MSRKIYHLPTPFTQHNRNTWQGLTSPDGTEYRNISDLHAFCLAHSLEFNQMYKLAKGEISEIEGWTRMG